LVLVVVVVVAGGATVAAWSRRETLRNFIVGDFKTYLARWLQNVGVSLCPP
jgi:hypothetical protein